MADDTVALLASEGRSTNVVFHFLSETFEINPVVVEDPVPRGHFLRRRVGNLGVLTVLGQLAFLTCVAPILRWRSQDRIENILDSNGLRDDRIPEDRIDRVDSVNTPATRRLVSKSNPGVIVINGTRIIGSETLGCTDATFLNLHAGITPRYRGVHGGYWALTEGREEDFGATVHVVDEGIDTGDVVEQVQIEPTEADNYATYPYLQLAAGLPRLEKAVSAALEGRLQAGPGRAEPSKLWSHPTVFDYLVNRVRHGVA